MPKHDPAYIALVDLLAWVMLRERGYTEQVMFAAAAKLNPDIEEPGNAYSVGEKVAELRAVLGHAQIMMAGDFSDLEDHVMARVDQIAGAPPGGAEHPAPPGSADQPTS